MRPGVRVAFYVGKGRLWDKVVRLATRSRYSHVELVLPGGLWVSSSPRDGGVRAKRINPKPGHWEFVVIPAHISASIMARMGTVPFGARYDWLGAFCTVLCPFRAEKRRRWFCSELVATLIGAPRPWRMTPKRLAAWIEHDMNKRPGNAH